MPTYKAPVSDTVFLLKDVFGYGKLANSPRLQVPWSGPKAIRQLRRHGLCNRVRRC